MLTETAAVADAADPADKARMSASPSSCSSTVLPILVASGLFIGAIIAGNFWLSVALGGIGTLALAYGVLVLREARKRMTDREKKP